MNLIRDILTIHTDNTKREYWKSVQARRDTHETRWHIILRRVMSKQFEELASKIDVTNYSNTDISINGKPMEDAIVRLYAEVGGDFAKRLYSQYKYATPYQLIKAEDEWMAFMINYIKKYGGDKISKINDYSTVQAKKVIRDMLNLSTSEGWGADKTASAIRKSLEELSSINTWRALRIARTEIMTASNIGAIQGARATGLPMKKYWVSTYDDRTRDTHRDIEGQNPKALDETFRVGIYDMEQPGDSTHGAGPEEVINCRCAISFEVIE